jgi:tRNA dimethylallyltransferase
MPPTQSRILAIIGPTASGKTSLALSIAANCDSEIVSADSRQIYKYLDIGTAKPNTAERRMVKHHFVDMLDPSEEYSAGRFGPEARQVIAEILKKQKLPIVVGGSGLYVKAVVDGLFGGPGKDPDIRLELEEQLRADGLDVLAETLRKVDPLALGRMKEITPRRVIRALEVYRITGNPMSQFQSQGDVPPDFDVYQVGLLWDRKELYQRIDERVESMMTSGLEDEVHGLKSKGYDRHLNALNTVGYKEVFDFMEGIHSHEKMIELIKRNSRRFAKRQMTWFKGDQRIHWQEVAGDDWVRNAAQKILKMLSARLQ